MKCLTIDFVQFSSTITKSLFMEEALGTKLYSGQF